MEPPRDPRKISRLGRRMDVVGKAVEALECGVVRLRPDGRVKLVRPRARVILKEFYASTGDHHLPAELAAWARRRKQQLAVTPAIRRLAPLVVERGESRLVARLLTGPKEDLLLLQVLRPPAGIVSLESAGLTRREVQVLDWVSQGKTNAEIGEILSLSCRTVQKHLEHIFVKLGVGTRTAAAAVALEGLRLPPVSRKLKWVAHDGL